MGTHQRAAEIMYKHIEGLTYEVSIITYVYTPSPADRPELTIHWGDGSSSVLLRTTKINLPDNISLNKYEYKPSMGANTNRHTYSSQGSYMLYMEDPNRNYGVVNIPNSVNVPMYVQTELIINPFLGFNNSPVLLNPPVDVGCVGALYIHNPGAYDVDGDSLSYKLVHCKTAGGIDIPGYVYPLTSNSFTINPVTGDVIWDTPIIQGEYNIAILIEEWRYGMKVGTMTRDMQIEIIACSSVPPVIQTISDTCVEVGTTLEFDVLAWDPDGTSVEITATGGPFEVLESPAYLDPDPAVGPDTVQTTFCWSTLCSHVQQQPYTVFFKAEDNGFPVHLVSFKTVFIKVISPAPENLQAEAIGNAIHLSWDEVACDKAVGYKIYRRNGYYGFVHGHCETGVPAYTGYVQIAENDGISNTTLMDDNNGNGLVPGIDYCYMVTAFFQDGAESYASLEACAALKRDVPVITNVSNDSTDLFAGRVYVAWGKPTELDTIQVPGPYQYKLYRNEGLGSGSFDLIATKDGLNDTLFIDNGVDLNNSAFPYSYKVWLESLTFGPVGPSQIGSSIFLHISSTDETLQLAWDLNVPWKNDYYVVYRKLPDNNTYDSVGFTPETMYDDTLLENKKQYCYYIKSVGGYSAPGFVDPIINYSQFACGTPHDNKPPCAPELYVYTNCSTVLNMLNWTNPNHYCADDVAGYYIYFSPQESLDLTLLDSVNNPNDTTYDHFNHGNIVGCYAVTAIDSTGNQSAFSNMYCVSDTVCSQYELPNVFTPNDDGYNDFFRPKPYTSVERIYINIFNRWGKIVFETEDPEINWDGRNMNNNSFCSPGTYFYICDVYEITLHGPRKRTLQGSITLLR